MMRVPARFAPFFLEERLATVFLAPFFFVNFFVAFFAPFLAAFLPVFFFRVATG